MTNRELERATALYHSDPLYQSLTGVLVDGLGPAGSGPAAGLDTPSQVTVTWLAHDVWVWRVDRVTLGDQGRDPWVCTMVAGESGQLDEECAWHRPVDPAALVTVLGQLGLTKGSAAPAGLPPATTAPGSPLPAPDPADGSTSLQATGSAPWAWALGGAAVAVTAVLVWSAVRRRGPVAELVDRSSR
jgi:hypothetical protein